ncbi:hypothetical protein DL96DRAFT_1415502, partial [Flagelloscypha sp. PMI_526]
KILTDNELEFIATAELLKRQYHFYGIRGSSYSSQPPGAIASKHYDVRERLVKLSHGDESKWPRHM